VKTKKTCKYFQVNDQIADNFPAIFWFLPIIPQLSYYKCQSCLIV